MILLPVGHYTGLLHPGAARAATYHAIRIGRLAVTISDEAAFAVWSAAHRPAEHRPAEQPDGPWTRSAVLAAAAARGVSEPAGIVEGFLADGILVEVDPVGGDAVQFAAAHRVVPLMVGLGNTPEDPVRHRIGLPGMGEPVLSVPTLAYDIWQWGAVGASLWEVCAAYADAGLRAGGHSAVEGDPRWVLARFLEALPVLVGVHAAYVDQARHVG